MKTVDIHSTKAEEIQHLKDIAATCKPGSYLASLFTPELIAHVEAQIKDDFTPDIMGELEAAHSQGITAATEYMKEIDSLKHQIRTLKDHSEAVEQQLYAANRNATRQQERVNRLYDRIDGISAAHNITKQKLYDIIQIAQAEPEA